MRGVPARPPGSVFAAPVAMRSTSVKLRLGTIPNSTRAKSVRQRG
jgi:hypothetical protein